MRIEDEDEFLPIEKYYESLPDEITIGIKIDKDVFIRMYELERKESSNVVMDSERKAVWGWLLETIRNYQRGIRFFYENDTKRGLPSVRFLDDDGKLNHDLDINGLEKLDNNLDKEDEGELIMEERMLEEATIKKNIDDNT